MYENGEQYTANGILILHVLRCVGSPVSDHHLTQLMMGPGLVNYFTMEQCLFRMIEAGFVDRSLDSMGVVFYSLTAQGAEMLDSLRYMIAGGLGARYEAYVREHRDEILRQMHIDADYFEDSHANLFVHCYVRDGLRCIVDLTLPVSGKAEAEAICREWRADSSGVYIRLLQALYHQKTEE